MTSQGLKRTPFFDIHVGLQAKMAPFAGFEMPIQYPTGITKEHEIVRTGVGVFDVSHMGEFEITGPDRNAFVQRITCNDISAIGDFQAQYTAMLTPEGTIMDDCIVYRFPDRLMMVVNAANIEKDFEFLVARKGGINIRLKDASDSVALLAVQGPRSEQLLQSLTKMALAQLKYYHFKVGQVAGIDCFVARTGYTGEDGFELYFRPASAEIMWHALVGEGRAHPVGLGCRDSLRLEVGYPLWGSDIDETTNPYEARLGWIVKLNKGAPFTGRSALEEVKKKGVSRKLVGFRMNEKAIPRHGYGVFLKGHKVDVVRSGGFGPSVGVPIGTTYLPTHSADPGTKIEIDCRGRRLEAEVVKLPFYTDGSVKRG